MRPPRKHQGQDGTIFFVTTVTNERVPHFTNRRNAEIAEEMIHWYKKRGDYWLLEYVIMPDHMHLLIAPKEKGLSRCLQNLKRTIAEKIHEEESKKSISVISVVGQKRFCPTEITEIDFLLFRYPSLWQPSFHDMIVRNAKQMEAFRHYIFQNPVKAKLSDIAESYLFSSMGKDTDRHRLSVGMHFPDHKPALLIATSNLGKIKEISESLRGQNLEIVTPLDLPYLEEFPKEHGDTFEANALEKARFYSERSGIPTLADDSGILVEALAKELGIHTRRWGAGSNANDQEWITHFLERMKKEKNKRARFVCVLCYIDANGREYVFEGTCDGEITETLEADYLPGLPISACFRPDGYESVYSGLSVHDKNRISHRGRAMQKFTEHMKSV